MATTLYDSRIRALQPEPAGTGPLYLQLVERLKTAIASGLYKDGDSLPPERVLAERLEVSRTTVKKALDELIRRGRVVSRHGSGNFIAALFEQPLARLSGLTDDMVARGGRRASSGSSGGEAGPARRRPWRSISGLATTSAASFASRFADGEPMCIERAVPARYLPDPTVVDQSLYAALRMEGLEPVRALQHLRAAALSPADAVHLALPAGTPVMATVRQGFLGDDRPIEFTRSIYRADRYNFVAEMRLGKG